MPAAPLWDPALCQFVGLLTVTDFINVLLRYRQTKMDVSTLGTRSIAETLASSNKSFQSADTSTSLKQACLLLHNHNLDFLPIMFPEDMRVLATVTYSNILEHVVTHFREQRRLFDDSIYDLKIGTYHDDVITIGPDKLLADALELLHKHSLSALPVVDENGKIISVYSRSDITFLLATGSDAEDALANLDLTLREIMAQQRTDVVTPDALHTCSKGHTLQSIFECFAQLRFNRLYVVDENDSIVGVVSARDLVSYFLEE
jgi:5'-AMP-activated protein kinase regulatory gamma subunit